MNDLSASKSRIAAAMDQFNELYDNWLNSNTRGGPNLHDVLAEMNAAQHEAAAIEKATLIQAGTDVLATTVDGIFGLKTGFGVNYGNPIAAAQAIERAAEAGALGVGAINNLNDTMSVANQVASDYTPYSGGSSSSTSNFSNNDGYPKISDEFIPPDITPPRTNPSDSPFSTLNSDPSAPPGGINPGFDSLSQYSYADIVSGAYLSAPPTVNPPLALTTWDTTYMGEDPYKSTSAWSGPSNNNGDTTSNDSSRGFIPYPMPDSGHSSSNAPSTVYYPDNSGINAITAHLGKKLHKDNKTSSTSQKTNKNDGNTKVEQKEVPTFIFLTADKCKIGLRVFNEQGKAIGVISNFSTDRFDKKQRMVIFQWYKGGSFETKLDDRSLMWLRIEK